MGKEIDEEEEEEVEEEEDEAEVVSLRGLRHSQSLPATPRSSKVELSQEILYEYIFYLVFKTLPFPSRHLQNI